MVRKLVSYLEMASPEDLRPARPVDDFSLERVEDPHGQDHTRISELHDAIATPHLWRSLHRDEEPPPDPRRSHWVARAGGSDIGWACLSPDDDGSVEIAVFGLVPVAVGRGYGGAFLTEIVRRAWKADTGERDVAARVDLHTSSWDHPHALDNYLARGFAITARKLYDQRADGEQVLLDEVEVPPDVLLRPALPIDAEAVAALVRDLGYDRPVGTIRQRLTRAGSSPDDLVAVAVRDGTDIVGVVTCHAVPLLAEADPAVVRITALSVASWATREGIGQRLVEFAEYFARRIGCRLLEVSSGRRDERQAAHRFYPAVGFEDTAAHSTRYWKILEPLDRRE